MLSPASNLTISLESEPADAVRVTVLEGLRAYNRLHVPAPGFQPLVLASRADDVIVAGLIGETGWEWLHIDLLWVAEKYRRCGLGRRLLHAAEREAWLRGARRAWLDTFDFQAKPFYERVGYVAFGAQEDYPPGHTRFFLRKDLVATK